MEEKKNSAMTFRIIEEEPEYTWRNEGVIQMEEKGSSEFQQYGIQVIHLP